MSELLKRTCRLSIVGDRFFHDYAGTPHPDHQKLKGNPRVDEVGGSFVADMLHSDGASFANLRVEDYRGAGAVLARTGTDGYDTNMPVCANFTAFRGYTGIIQVGVDWMINFPRIAGMAGAGIDFQAGACACVGGQVYGCNVGGNVVGADVAINGTEFSDCRIGLAVLGDGCQLTGVYSERCDEKNVIIGARTSITNLIVKTKAFVDPAATLKPTAVDIINDSLGCGNWTQWTGGIIDELRAGYTGINLTAHAVRIAGVQINGTSDSIGLRMAGCEKCVVDVSVCGSQVDLSAMGGGNRVYVNWHNSRPKIIAPSDYPARENRIFENGIERAAA